MTSNELNNHKPQTKKRGLWLPFILGALAVISFDLVNMIGRLLGHSHPTFPIGIAPFVFICFSAFSSFRLPSRSLPAVSLMFFLGIPMGIIIYIITDAVFFSYQHTLWPFEIIIWWAVAAIPVPIGILLGSYFVSDQSDISGMVKRLTTPNLPDSPKVEISQKAKCPNCGATLGQGAKMCVWCGLQLPDSSSGSNDNE